MIIVIYIVLGIVGLVVIAVIMYSTWFFWQTRPRRPKENGYKYIHVEDDGSAREVTAEEKEYLEAEFHPADGARPYIKLRYESLTPIGNISGFLGRRQLPSNIQIDPAPSSKRNLLSEEERKEYITQSLRKRGRQ